MLPEPVRANGGPYLTLERHREALREARANHVATGRAHELCERKLQLLDAATRSAGEPSASPALTAARGAATAELRACQMTPDQRRGRIHACLRRRVAE
jgi:hypothetical protein